MNFGNVVNEVSCEKSQYVICVKYFEWYMLCDSENMMFYAFSVQIDGGWA